MKPDPTFDKALAAAERLGYSYEVAGKELQAKHEAWVTANAEAKDLEDQLRYANNRRRAAKEEVEAAEAIMQALIADRQKRRGE